MQKKIYLFSAFLLLSFFQLVAQTSVSLPSQEISCGERLVVPITVGGFTDLNGLSLSVEWDPAALAYDTSTAIPAIINNPNNPQNQFNTNNTAGGKIGFTWVDVNNEISVADGESIIFLTFNVIGNNFNTTTLNFVSNPTPIGGSRNDANGIPTDVDFAVTSGVLTLMDADTPTIVCQGNQSATTVSGSTSVAVANIAPTPSDNCGIASTTYTLSGATTGSGTDDASGELFNIGTTTITYTTTDFANNNASCAFDVVVTAGTVGSNDNLTLRAGSLIDQCGGTVDIPISVVGFQEITALEFTFSFDATQFTYQGITDIDLAGLTINDFNVSQSGMGTISVTWQNDIAQTKLDEEGLFNIQLSSTTAVTNSPVGISNATAQQNNIDFPVMEGNGTVTLQDNTAPEISCPANQTIAVLPGILSTVVNNIDATATDNCGDATFTYSMTGSTSGGGVGSASGMSFNTGLTTVTYMATDESGNTSDCSFTVNVESESAANFTLIAQSVAVSCDTDDIAIAINVAAFDTIGAVQFTVNWDTDVLTYVSTETGVFDEGAGAAFGVSDIANGNIGYAWADFDGQTLPDGSTLFTLHFSAVGGGSSTINFDSNTPTPLEVSEVKTGIPTEIPVAEIVTVAGTVEITDEEDPTIGCPADQTIAVAAGETTVVVNDLDPVVTDNCGVATVTYTLSGATVGSGMDSASGQTFNIGTTTVTYTATDGAGNTSTCSSLVTIDSPGAMTVNVVNNNAVCGTEPFKVDITADNFTNGVGIQFSVNWGAAVLQYDSINFNQGLAGIVSNDFQFGDTDNGNLGFAWFDGEFEPRTLPDGTVLFSIYYSVLGIDGANTTITITDDPVLREGSILSGGAPMGVPLIGNSSQIDIVDNTPPVVTSPFPETITLYIPADACMVTGTWTEPTFIDACSNNITVDRSALIGATFPVGDTVIIYTATDPSGNSVSDRTILQVRDTIAPVIMNCPADITVTADENCQAVANWTAPTGGDNCDFMVISSTHNPGSIFTQTTVVTYTAEDAFGNRSTCSFTVTVDGVTPIVFNEFPGNLMVNAAQGQCGANIGWTPPTATGGCNADSAATITLTTNDNIMPGDFFPVGVNTVTYTATDEAGQSISNSFTVTVVDNQDLTAICPTDIIIQADGTVLMDEGNFINTITSDSCSRYVITYNDIMAFDNCSPISINQTQGPASGSQFTFGTTMMEFVLSDTLGNNRTCTFQITINETNDLAATTLDNPTCAGANLRLAVNTLMDGAYQWTGPGGFLANVQNPVIPNAMTQNSGEYVVKVISGNGCTIKDSIMVGILSAPEISAMGNDLSCTTDGLDTIRLFASVTNGIPIETYQWTGPGGFNTDFQNPIIPNATTSAVGQYFVTGTSSNGCSDIDTVVVGLAGMVMPTLTTDASSDTICANSPITLTGTAYDGGATYTWIAPDGAGLPTIRDTNVIVATPTEPGTYTYEFTANLDGNCTSDTASVSFVVIGGAGAITIGSNGPFDCAALNQTIDLTATGGTDITAYSWSGPNGFTSSEQNPSIPADNAASGTYTLMATSTNGCTSINTIDVAVSFQGAAPDVIITNAAGAITGLNACEGDVLTFNGQDIPNATYEWVGPNGFTSDQRVITFSNIMSENAGAYQLRTTVDGCTSAPRTVGPINVLTEPVANNDDFMIVKGTSTMINLIDNDVLIPGVPFSINIMSGTNNGVLVNNNDGTFNFRPNDGVGGKEELAYEVCYVDCPTLCDMATITLDIGFSSETCTVPTFISPNGDGFNDLLVISCIVGEPKAGSELIVFNEWGSEVYRQERYNNDWAGTYNGEDLPDGTYYYIYKADNDDPDPKKGYVTIFR